MNNNLTFYLYLQKRLLDNSDKEKMIKQSDAKMKISNLRIPKKLIPFLLKDLENLELGKRISKFEFGIINWKRCYKIERLLRK